MASGETIGTEQYSVFTRGDAARWFVALVLVAGMGAGGAMLARQWTAPSGDDSLASAPAVLLELEPMPAPEPEVMPEPVAEPMPEPVVEPEPQPQVEPPPPEPAPVPEEVVPDPLPHPEPVEPPVSEPEPPIELPPAPEEPEIEPEAAPEPEAEPVPEPVPEVETPELAFPMPAVMSPTLQQRRAETPATNPQPPRQTPPERPRQQQPAPQQQAAPQPTPSQPSTAASGVTQDQWQQQVQRRINRNKVYPRAAQRAGLAGVVQVSVTIDSSGRLLSASLARSSGIAGLDNAAVEAVRRAAPFPRPPASVGQGSIAFTAPIRFSAD